MTTKEVWEHLDKATVHSVTIQVAEEVFRQDNLARAGRFRNTHIMSSGPDHARLAVLVEEVGEVARELNEGFSVVGTDVVKLRKELVQVAAVAVAWAAAIDGGQA